MDKEKRRLKIAVISGASNALSYKAKRAEDSLLSE